MSWALPTTTDVGQLVVPNSGDTVTAAQGTTLLLVNNASLLAVLNVVLPPNPVDCQRFTICSASAITLLNLSGGTIKGGLTTLVANGFAKYNYSQSVGAWFRTG